LPETCRRNFVKLNYNKEHLVGFNCNNCITMHSINNVKFMDMLFTHLRFKTCIDKMETKPNLHLSLT